MIAFLGYQENSLKWVFFYNENIYITTVQLVSNNLSVVNSKRLQEFLDKHNIKPIMVFENLNNPTNKKIAYRTLKPFSRNLFNS
jgi:ABC-type Zn uptake system ZnuABC Zn-binding protein ZnuA